MKLISPEQTSAQLSINLVCMDAFTTLFMPSEIMIYGVDFSAD